MKTNPAETTSDLLLTVTAHAFDADQKPVKPETLKESNPAAHAAWGKLERGLKRIFSKLAAAAPPPTFFADVAKMKQAFSKDSGLGVQVEMTLARPDTSEKVSMKL